MLAIEFQCLHNLQGSRLPSRAACEPFVGVAWCFQRRDTVTPWCFWRSISCRLLQARALAQVNCAHKCAACLLNICAQALPSLQCQGTESETTMLQVRH